MFVEKLSKEQVRDFIRRHLIEADFHPELPNNKCPIEFVCFKNEEAIEAHYCSKLYNRHISLYLMDDRMEPWISKELENAWIQYLYSVFGEEYKNWYLSEKANLFN